MFVKTWQIVQVCKYEANAPWRQAILLQDTVFPKLGSS